MGRKPFPKIGGKNELAELLGTTDRQTQVERVRQLMTPVIDLVVRYDNRFNQVSITTLGADISYEQARVILKLGEEKIRELELQALAAQMQKSNGQPQQPIAEPMPPPIEEAATPEEPVPPEHQDTVSPDELPEQPNPEDA